MPAPVLPADLFSSDDWLTLLNVSLTGIQLLRPVYAPDGATVVDFTFVYTNPAGLRMIGLTQQPTGSMVAQFPHAPAAGILAYYQQAFAASEPLTYETNYQADGLDNYILFRAQRSGEQLLISFTDTSNQPRTVVEQALRASQAREQAALAEAQRQQQLLQQVFENAPMPLALFRGADYVVEVANPALAELWGRPLAQVVGHPVFTALPDLRDQGFDEILADVLHTGQPFRAHELPAVLAREHLGLPALGYFNVSYEALRDVPGGPVTSIIASAVEVTAQVLARQQLVRLNQELEARVQQRTQEALALQAELLAAAQRQAQARETFYQVFAQTPAAICIQRGPEHRYEYINAAYQRFFPGRDFLTRSVAEVLPEAVEAGAAALLDQVYQTGETYYGTELPILVAQPEGPAKWSYFTFTYQALREQGEIVGIATFAYDVAEQVLARRERETQQQLVNAVFEQAPVALFVATGPTYVLEVLNEPMVMLLGSAREQLLGRPYFEAVPELASQGFRELLDQVWQSGQAVAITEMPAQLIGRPLGELTYFNFVYQPLQDAQGQVHSIACVAVDVTEQVLARQQVQTLNEELAVINEELRATNEELNHSNTQLTRTNVDLDTFVYTASHDLKAPITNIEGLLEALRYQLPAEVQQEETTSQLLGMMQGAVERFRYTIDQLTDVSRLQQAQDQPTEQVVLLTVIKDVLLDLRPLLLSTRARLTVDVGAEVQVLFSPKNLRSVVVNLLSNALKYHQAGRPPIVYLRATTLGSHVVFTVQDEGLGLSAVQQERLFGLFQRLHVHVEGTGVGLYMVKRMVENAGGTITVQSEQGVGTAFTVTLPR